MITPRPSTIQNADQILVLEQGWIQEAISLLVRGKPVLVIAHRMRTVAGANQLVVLENGKVSQQGAPEELMRQGGLYHRMAREML